MATKSVLVIAVLGYLSLDAAIGRASAKPAAGGNRLKIMTFNTWIDGAYVNGGLEKIAKHIKAKDPDFVTLQEVQKQSHLEELVKALGGGWSQVGRIDSDPNVDHPDTAILTRHAISDFSNKEYATVGAKITVAFDDGTVEFVNVWSVHLDYNQYGPYAACSKKSDADILDGERNKGGSVQGRVGNVEDILKQINFTKDIKNEQELMLVAGDLNAPSHLDWTPEAKDKHCGRSFEWPASKMFVDAGLKDAFRQLNPDPVKVPGNTWSTVVKTMEGTSTPEPQDRVDMIFYKSSKWSPISAEVYAGDKELTPYPNQKENDWPSDHYSVIIEFKKD